MLYKKPHCYNTFIPPKKHGVHVNGLSVTLLQGDSLPTATKIALAI